MKSPTRHHYRSLLAATLLLGGSMSWMPAAFAEGTTGGTAISNTATATYVDANNPNTPINSTSNTVVVQVAEVAGITVTASGTSLGTDVNSNGQVNAGDTVNYTYTVTNVGNDPTKFRIPNLATVTGPASVSGNLEVSTNGGTTWAPITGSELITASIPVGGAVMVRVPVLVTSSAQSNDIITVTLGDTPGDGQNLLRNPNGGDVYTVDNPDTDPAPEVDGAPVNGTREASITQRVTVDATLKTYALATILKTRTGYDNQGSLSITGDTIDYGFNLRVESTDPTGNNIAPAPLVGMTSLQGAAAGRILVSDAIPAGTELSAVPTPPPGWQAVYTTDAVATTTATAATWKAFPLQGGDTLSAVTRVGFVNNPTIITSIAPGTTVNGFTMQLKVTSTATSLTVANMAQLFGQTSGTNTPVYDESGDQMPSNYNDNGTPLNAGDPVNTVDTNGDGVPDRLPPGGVDDGYINNISPQLPETGSDPANNNSATGSTGGEANTFTVSAPVAGAVQNGPNGAPDAVGPTSANDDFTNKSSLVPANTLPGSTLDPAPVAFTNTVRNSGTDAGTVILQPDLPAVLADLPGTGTDPTTVTITYGSDSVVYSYNGTAFTLTSSTVPGGGPIIIPNILPGQSVNYGVEVNLPVGTPLSTDLDGPGGTSGNIIAGFPVPIRADIYAADTNGDTVKNALDTVSASNTTIDRVYTGFLRMLKESRVLVGTGPAVQGSDGTFSTTAKKPAPGNIIEYRITYTNISEAQSGTGNVILNAANVAITESGNSGTNNWAIDNDGNGQIDTSNIVGTAKDSGAATVTFFSGNPSTSPAVDQTGTTANTDVTQYVNTVTGNVVPGQSRTFGFQRKVN
jgi:hypothetical protein